MATRRIASARSQAQVMVARIQELRARGASRSNAEARELLDLLAQSALNQEARNQQEGPQPPDQGGRGGS